MAVNYPNLYEHLKFILQFILTALGIYFTYYLREKGKSLAQKEDLGDITLEVAKMKNLATKEDIGGITREVQKVKDEFVSKQALFQKDLDIILSDEIAYRTEERNAVIEFSLDVNEWWYQLDAFEFSKHNLYDSNGSQEKYNELINFYPKVGRSKSKVTMLIEDEKLKLSADDFFSKVIDFHKWLLEILSEMDNFNNRLRYGDDLMKKKEDVIGHGDSSSTQVYLDAEKKKSDAFAEKFTYLQSMCAQRLDKKKGLPRVQENYNQLANKYLRG